MIIYYTRAPGRGHITRAAALARRQEEKTFVVHYSDWTEPLDWAGIPHAKSMFIPQEQRQQATKILIDGKDFYRMGQCRTPHSSDAIDMETFPTILPFDHEILSREAARDALGLSHDDRVLFAVHNTFEDQITRFADRAPGFKVIHEFPYPLAIYLRAADAVVGNAGYNLYYETQKVKVPAFLVPADPRQANDQILRVRPKFMLEWQEFLSAII